MDERTQLKIVLKRLVEENGYALEEYARWVTLAGKAGGKIAAEKIREAEKLISEANDVLRGALETIR